MNVQSHISGQLVSNQLPQNQQNGNALSQMQNLTGSAQVNTFSMDSELLRARKFMQEKIFAILLQRHHQPINELQRAKFTGIVKRLEDGLFKAAHTKEDYMNLETLEIRLQNLIKPAYLNRSQQTQHVNSSTPMSTMMPTPGMSHAGNSNMHVACSADTLLISASGSNSIAPANLNTGSLLPIGNGSSIGMNAGSLSATHGSLISNGYQQSPANFSIGSGGNISAMGLQRTASQMIPTPGFNTNNTHSYMNLEPSNIGVGFSTVDSTMASQPQQQKQHVGGLNSRILQNLGSQMGHGIRSSWHQKPYVFSNGTLNSGLGMMGNSTQPVNGPGTSEGDGYGLSNGDTSGAGNFCGTMPSVGLMSPTLKAESIDQSEKTHFQSSLPSRETFLQSHHHQQQFQQQTHQYQQQQQNFQQKRQQNQQHQLGFGQSPLVSDLGGQVKSEPGVPRHNEVLHSQISEHIKLSELQNQFQQNSAEDLSRSAQSLMLPSGQHANCSSRSQNQQIQQVSHPHQLVAELQSDMGCFSVGSESVLPGQWNSYSNDATNVPQITSHEQNVQEDFRQRISGQNEAQRNNLSSEGSVIGEIVVSRSTTDPPSSSSECRSKNTNRERRNQQRWLLFLRHARKCAAPEGKCLDVNCVTVQKLWRHMDTCKLSQCLYPRCHHSKLLILHYRNCKNSHCPVCIPVKNFIQTQLKARTHPESASGLPIAINRACKTYDAGVTAAITSSMTSSVFETSGDHQPSVKRMKFEQPSQAFIPANESSAGLVSANREPHACGDVQPGNFHYGEMREPILHEISVVKMEVSSSTLQGPSNVGEIKKDDLDDLSYQRPDSEPIICNEAVGFAKKETVKGEKEIDEAKPEKVAVPGENAVGTKSGKPKIKGVSLIELFTPEQVREHIRGLRQWVGQSKSKAEKNQAMERSMSENSCQLCAVEKLTFEPPPIYCTPCGARIKRNGMYYAMGSGDTRHCVCIPCYNETRGDTIAVDGTAIPKGKLEKKKNDEETEEWWVQCDKCEAWQHQICALFNGRRNDGGQAEYTCPNCYMLEVENGERMPLSQSAVLGAKDLPRTILSDHIEQRLFRRLKQERQDRARLQGKSYDEVPGAEALVVRVVSSVDKKLEVKQRFLEIFQEDNYPTEFPYKSKVILLFQKIEGVEVCLFGMYVQEFGSECQFPNQRRVYLSYLDSVKYFRPEIKAVSGEALRTFVYHEILIGYLEYCKKRGFTSCYIWACPPLKGEDYILYCHPEIQKTPKSDKLREWYLSMLRKASKENIVVDLTNLYDHFFVCNGESKAKVTAARLPYFDGDYWPGAAEDLIYQLQQEEDDRKHNKKGTTKKMITKRALKASGQSDLSANASKDLMLMRKLGETISPMKEDFIMVHLQHACTHCCTLMVSRNRWVCRQCKNFQLCDKCYEVEQKLEERERHPISHREKHYLYPAEITDVTTDTKDKDEILESEFFDTRQAFLSLCQGNHYQYDTLRRAKHSSMMVLYHLHNPTAPAFVITCNVCHLDIEAGQGWRCEVCPDYDVCNACYKTDGGIDHPHKLTNHTSLAERDAQNTEARQQRVLQLRKMLDLLVHASQCRSSQCQYPNCRKVKGLFRHGMQCRIRASGGCVLCKKMWYLLQLHARACKESECHVPRCRDLKEHLRRLQQQSDSRRRAAVMEMMRQRAAEVAGNV